MKFTFNGKNISLTDALKDRTVSKINKLGKFFKGDVEVFVTLEAHRSLHKMEVTIPYSGVVFRAEAASEDMYSSLDKVVDILERQFRKNKTRLAKKMHDNAFDPSNYAIHEDVSEEKDFNVQKVKRFAIKPIDIEEAILQMNLIGHQFFVFSNSTTGDVNVVYKRKDGNYGLIEPEY
jgi:putative sigma-54 modulation protein